MYWAKGRPKIAVMTSERRDIIGTGIGPDGMTVSRDGNLWVAVPGDGSGNGAVICYCSKTGEEITRVGHPPPNYLHQCIQEGPFLLMPL